MRSNEMTNILFRLLVAAALTLAAFALSSPAHGQQADEDATSTSSRSQERAPQTPAPPESQTPSRTTPSSPGDQTQDELVFTGRIEQERGTLVLKDPVTKLSYQLDEPARAKKFIGKQVKVTGKLDMKSNIIQVSSINLVP